MRLVDDLVAGKVSDDDLSALPQETLSNALNELVGKAVRGAEQVRAVERLLSAGAAAQPTTDGWNALHLAAVRNQPQTIDLLLDSGFDPNVLDPDGRSPLYLSIRFRSSHAQQALQSQTWHAATKVLSCDPERIAQLSPSELVSLNGSPLLSEMLLHCIHQARIDAMRLKLPFDARTWGAKEDEKLQSVFERLRPVLDVLSDAGVDWNTDDAKGHPLYDAVQTRIVPLVVYLLERGSQVEVARRKKPVVWDDIVGFQPNQTVLKRAQACVP